MVNPGDISKCYIYSNKVQVMVSPCDIRKSYAFTKQVKVMVNPGDVIIYEVFKSPFLCISNIS